MEKNGLNTAFITDTIEPMISSSIYAAQTFSPVTRADEGMRLDKWLCKNLGGLSRSACKKLLHEGAVHILLPGRVSATICKASDASLPLVAHATLSLVDIEPGLDTDRGVLTKNLSTDGESIQLICEIDGIVLINKAAGIPTHANQIGETHTLANWLAERYEGFFDNRVHPLQGYLINRLDTASSGIILAATNYNRYQQWLQADKPHPPKVYLALCRGSWPFCENQGSSEWPIAHDAQSKRRAVAVGSNKARKHRGSPRPARTIWYKVQQSNVAFLALAALHRGQYHQIRVHAHALDCPLAGDAVYTASGESSNRHGLHAWAILFDGKVHFADIPSSFYDLCETWGIHIDTPCTQTMMQECGQLLEKMANHQC